MILTMSTAATAPTIAAPRTYDDAVATLAQAHADGCIRIVIYTIPDPHRKVVRLMEVSDDFPEAGVDRPTPGTAPNGLQRIVPVFPMNPSGDFPFRSEVAQVTTDEWDDLQRGHLDLTAEWDLTRAQEVLRVQ